MGSHEGPLLRKYSVLAETLVLQPGHSPTLRRVPAILRTLEPVGSTSSVASVLRISPRRLQCKIKEHQQNGSALGKKA